MRSVHCLYRDWKFVRADVVGAEASTFDDARWQRVGLPHTFDLPYFRTPEFYVGVGWYRRTLDIPADWIGRAVWLHFEAAFQVADVYLNGVHVGGHRG
ncbi:MAG TPA: hypothetical protein PKB10_05965, partial [Tepidisphaeraceae bacterium]|nr:hypothetical protein [Tepidisphaeraceae bacterium]